MEALRDPFSRVHPVFWPVLWLSLRAFARWTGRMIEEGHAYAGLRVELTWYGWIHVEAIDLTEVGADFRRHMMGAAREDGWGVLHRASVRVGALFASAAPSCGHGLRQHKWIARISLFAAQTAFEVCEGVDRNIQQVFAPGTGPPLGPAPFPRAGGGAVPLSLVAPHPRLARAPVLA
ncbi:MAG: hypothetical protein AAFX86_12475 [Pseudomonadota bacterium]